MVSLKGSDRQPVANASSVGPAHPDERFEITLVMRPNDMAGFESGFGQIVQGLAAPMTHEEYATKHATSYVDVQKVVDFAHRHNLTVVQVDTSAHRVILGATVAKANAAFNVDLQMFSHPDGVYRGRTGTLEIPQELVGVVDAVLGLDNRKVAIPHFRATPKNFGGNASYFPNEVASLYDFPAGDGHGQCIALIELGGGYRTADLDTYFHNELNFTTAPTVVSVAVDGVSNAPTGDPNGPDGEVVLDVQVAGAVAPGAKIAVYFSPNTDAGFLNAITTAMHDTVNRPTVISISWGGPEVYWTSQAMQAFDAAFRQAAILGINICVASGDNGSSDGVSGFGNHVDFPASSPHVIACGGTNIQVANGAITSETVWNGGSNGGASGGGISTEFWSFDWQKAITVDGVSLHHRGVPDVAGNADPASGYNVTVDGQQMVIGGTSAVAPLWAALIARINSNLGKKIGYVHPKMYAGQAAFNDIVVGNNGSFAAVPGWDACTGMGSPKGVAIRALFA